MPFNLGIGLQHRTTPLCFFCRDFIVKIAFLRKNLGRFRVAPKEMGKRGRGGGKERGGGGVDAQFCVEFLCETCGLEKGSKGLKCP